jgi:hypothetical protein
MAFFLPSLTTAGSLHRHGAEDNDRKTQEWVPTNLRPIVHGQHPAGDDIRVGYEDDLALEYRPDALSFVGHEFASQCKSLPQSRFLGRWRRLLRG